MNIKALKREIQHLISVRPGALELLQALKTSHKHVLLITNAHEDSLSLKMEKTALAHYFDRVISAHQYGQPKEKPGFWKTLETDTGLIKSRCLFIDDNLTILRAAQAFGIAQLLAVAKPDSQSHPRGTAEFEAIEHFNDLLPIDD
jgi:putative hydrolase of the HAD superfamily